MKPCWSLGSVPTAGAGGAGLGVLLGNAAVVAGKGRRSNKEHFAACVGPKLS